MQKGHHTWMSMHKCFKHRHIITLECWDWTKDKVVWWRETETMDNVHLGNGILVSAIMKKSKNGCHFINMLIQKNFKLLTPTQKKFSYGFLSVHGNGINGISVLAIMKKSKNGCHFINIYIVRKNFKLWTRPKFRSLVYPTNHLCVALHFLIFF